MCRYASREGVGARIGGNRLHVLPAGKEYVCVARLHNAIPSEAKFAQVCSPMSGDDGRASSLTGPGDDLHVRERSDHP